MKALFIISLFGFIIFALVFVVALNKDLNEKVWKRIAYISPILSAVCFISLLLVLPFILAM